ncbi:hypothetical protein C0991_002588 [Blastosporella zonata]|nr:hypothetical protein C0991_002588 [Blastosporella zonata]
MARYTKRQAHAKSLVNALLAYSKAHTTCLHLRRLQSWQHSALLGQITLNALSHDNFSLSRSLMPDSPVSAHFNEDVQFGNRTSDSKDSDPFDDDDNTSYTSNSSNGSPVASDNESELSDLELDGMPKLMALDASDFDNDLDDNFGLGKGLDHDTDSNSSSSAWSSDLDLDSDLGWEGDTEDLEEEESLACRVWLSLTCHAITYHFPRGPAILPHVLNVLKQQHPDHFRQELHVSPYTFDSLVTSIIGNTVFANNSQNEQIPVEEQLAIYLYHLGHFGNAAGLDKVAKWAGYSKGTITLATCQNIQAPTPTEKEKAKTWVEEHSCYEWQDGWCMVDGTLIPLYNRPY